LILHPILKWFLLGFHKLDFASNLGMVSATVALSYLQEPLGFHKLDFALCEEVSMVLEKNIFTDSLVKMVFPSMASCDPGREGDT
jgi:hypothetical protein